MLYLTLSFAIANDFGQWSYEGELIRTAVRLAWVASYAYLYFAYFRNDLSSAEKKGAHESYLSFLIIVFLIFGLGYTNGTNESLVWQIVFAISGLVAGIREELLYRGIVQTIAQNKYGQIAGLWLASCLFTLSHVQYIFHGQFYSLLLIHCAGIIFGCIYFYTQNIIFTGTIHGLYDAFLSVDLLPYHFDNNFKLPLLLIIAFLFYKLTISTTESTSDKDMLLD
jgi:membrane protease YdiL (CAAX protease family)